MKNKLDPFAKSIDAWREEGKTWGEIVKLLKDDGCVTSPSSLSEFYGRRQAEQEEEGFLQLITSGGEMNRKLDEAYAKNPEPEIGKLVRMGQTLVMTLQVQGAKDPSKLKAAKAWFDSILKFISARTAQKNKERELEQGERKLVILEKKAAQADQAADVTHSNLSPEQKAERMREIFKKA